MVIRAIIGMLAYYAAAVWTGAYYEVHCKRDGVFHDCAMPPLFAGVGWPIYWSYRLAAMTVPEPRPQKE